LKAKPPPGVLVYEKDDYSIYEIDGEEHKVSRLIREELTPISV
jgi:hypothetical protein